MLLIGGLDPTRLLIWSQVVLSFGIPFALIPLVQIARDKQLMALAPTRRATVALAWVIAGADHRPEHRAARPAAALIRRAGGFTE